MLLIVCRHKMYRVISKLQVPFQCLHTWKIRRFMRSGLKICGRNAKLLKRKTFKIDLVKNNSLKNLITKSHKFALINMMVATKSHSKNNLQQNFNEWYIVFLHFKSHLKTKSRLLNKEINIFLYLWKGIWKCKLNKYWLINTKNNHSYEYLCLNHWNNMLLNWERFNDLKTHQKYDYNLVNLFILFQTARLQQNGL